MNLTKLKPFVISSSKSSNLKIKQAAETLANQMMQAQEAEEIAQPTLHAQSNDKPLNDKPKDEIDVSIGTWMQDITKPEPSLSQFGKAASAYSADIAINSLPKATQDDVLKFVPKTDKKNKVVLYGMVVDELKPKVDHHNWEAALSNVKKEYNKSKKALADKFQGKIDNKYILILNDTIVDGHHCLAMADVLGISCSLKVLDLTPLRFQQKTAASLFDYVIYNNRRKGAA
jgi:hypothetical protein